MKSKNSQFKSLVKLLAIYLPINTGSEICNHSDR